MNKYFSKDQRIGEIVVKLPIAMEVFKKYNIDFCCGGDRILKAAIEEKNSQGKNYNEDKIVQELNEAYEKYVVQDNKEVDWTKETYKSLIEYIINTHHSYLGETLPRLSELTLKIFKVHGDNHEELAKVYRLFGTLRMELEQHLIKEEKEVFPLIIKYEESKDKSVLEAAIKKIQELEDEHEGAGTILKELREITDGYTAPQDGCNTYKATYKLLEELESDTFKHIHLENNILFPSLK